MDRFIVFYKTTRQTLQNPLKSNMDRFIDRVLCHILLACNTLKSNMDRFIVKNGTAAQLPFKL